MILHDDIGYSQIDQPSEHSYFMLFWRPICPRATLKNSGTLSRHMTHAQLVFMESPRVEKCIDWYVESDFRFRLEILPKFLTTIRYLKTCLWVLSLHRFDLRQTAAVWYWMSVHQRRCQCSRQPIEDSVTSFAYYVEWWERANWSFEQYLQTLNPYELFVTEIGRGSASRWNSTRGEFIRGDRLLATMTLTFRPGKRTREMAEIIETISR
jgi:hypothetical protein